VYQIYDEKTIKMLKERGLYTSPNENSFKSDREIKRDLALKGELEGLSYDSDIKVPRDVNYYLDRAKMKGELMKEMSPRANGEVKLHLKDTSIFSIIGDWHYGHPNTHEDRIKQELEVIKNTPNSFIVFTGDLLHGIHWGGASGSEQSVTLDEQRLFLAAVFRELKGRIALGISGEHDCMDSKTEALTKRGWLTHDKIKKTDEFLTLNPNTELLEWHKYTHFHKYTVKDLEMVRINTRDFDFFGTDNHRFFVQGRRNKKYSFKPASEFAKQWWGNEYIPMAGTFGLPPYKISNNLIALIAWIMADGWIEKNKRIRIGQRQEKSNYIRNILKNENIDFSEIINKTKRNGDKVDGKIVKKRKNFITFEIKDKKVKRLIIKLLKGNKHKIPDFMWKVSDSQFEIFLKNFMLADGTSNRKGSGLIFQKNKKFINDMQALCAMHGYRSSPYVYSNTYGIQRRLNVCKRTGMRFNSPRKISKKEKYTGIIWDITIPNGNFMVRRNGKSYFTGNSKWAARTGADPYFDFTERTGAPYIRGIAEVEMTIGEQVYKMVNQHKARGHSIYNKNHPTFRESRFDLQGADIYTSNHNHRKQTATETIRVFGGARIVVHAASGAYVSGDEFGERQGFPSLKPEEMYGVSLRVHKDSHLVEVEYDILEAHKKWG